METTKSIQPDLQERIAIHTENVIRELCYRAIASDARERRHDEDLAFHEEIQRIADAKERTRRYYNTVRIPQEHSAASALISSHRKELDALDAARSEAGSPEERREIDARRRELHDSIRRLKIAFLDEEAKLNETLHESLASFDQQRRDAVEKHTAAVNRLREEYRARRTAAEIADAEDLPALYADIVGDPALATAMIDAARRKAANAEKKRARLEAAPAPSSLEATEIIRESAAAEKGGEL